MTPFSHRTPRILPLLAVLLSTLSFPADAADLTSARGETLHAKKGMVVSASPLASKIGAGIIERGGNAFDAAAATGFALAVTFPQAGNIGGGGFMVARRATGETISLDFRETAPAAGHRDMYLDEAGKVVPGLSLRSSLASGVPGSVDGLLTLWRRFGSGTISREDLLAPAIRLASEGFTVSAGMAASLNTGSALFAKDPGASKIFMREDGRPWREGDRFVQPDLGRTLQRIADEGRDGFYRGPVAGWIAEQQARSNGLITRADLEAYASTERPPVRGSFNEYEIVSMGPPSSGGVLLIQMLNMLKERGVEGLKHGSVEYVHLLTEVQRRAYADRATHLGDPDYWDVPIESLTSIRYARDRARSIAMARATPSSDVGAGDAVPYESTETTHYSVADGQGNAVAVTVTLNSGFGSGIVIDGAGFLMNNEMDDFSAKPGVPNLYGVIGGKANAIEPGKRMLSSMTPTVVLKNGHAVMLLGSPGGATIINTVLQVFLNVALHEMTLQEAVSAPRHHSQWLPDRIVYEESAIMDDVRDALRAMGHSLSNSPGGIIGAANCIYLDKDGLHGAPDYRRQSGVAGI